MKTKTTLAGVATIVMAALFGAGCSNNASHDYLEQQVQRALQDNNLGVWQVESLVLEEEQQKRTDKDSPTTTYQFNVALVLQEDLQLVRYADADARELVVTPGPRAGEQVTLPAVARVEGPLGEASSRAHVSLPLTDLPPGLPVSLLRDRFADWQQIGVGSEAYQAMLERLRRQLLDEQRALTETADRLRRGRMQLEAKDEELKALEEDSVGQSSGMGEPMERLSGDVQALMSQVEQLQVEKYTREDTVKKLRADLDHLQGK